MNTEKLKEEMAELDREINLLMEKKRLLQRAFDSTESRRYIEAMGITKLNTLFSGDPDLPWMGTVWAFRDWLKENRTSYFWAEWNGRVYRVSDLMEGRMPESPALWEDVK